MLPGVCIVHPDACPPFLHQPKQTCIPSRLLLSGRSALPHYHTPGAGCCSCVCLCHPGHT